MNPDDARRQLRPPRRMPAWSELRPLLRMRRLDPDRRQARLAAAQDVEDLRRLARRRTPRAAFEYVDGGAEAEHAVRRNRAAYGAIEFQPSVLRDVSHVDLSTRVFGSEVNLPVGIAPTGFTRLMHTDGEVGGAAAAGRFGIPFSLSTMGTAGIEDVAGACPGTRRWFQLYLWKERRDHAVDLVHRAAAAGYDTLIVTVDTAVGGLRHRDARNGMTVPPQLTVRTLLDASYRPEWWFNLLTTEPLRFATLTDSSTMTSAIVGQMFDPSVTLDDLSAIRREWRGALLVKGIQSVEDAVKVRDAGADGVWLSNHGGRQLDRAPVPLHLLPRVRQALDPQAQVLVDSGIMSGGDVLAALALGADMAMVGRAYLYGLMAGGTEGVVRMLEILRTEMTVTLQLLGLRRVRDLNPDHVRLDWRPESPSALQPGSRLAT